MHAWMIISAIVFETIIHAHNIVTNPPHMFAHTATELQQLCLMDYMCQSITFTSSTSILLWNFFCNAKNNTSPLRHSYVTACFYFKRVKSWWHQYQREYGFSGTVTLCYTIFSHLHQSLFVYFNIVSSPSSFFMVIFHRCSMHTLPFPSAYFCFAPPFSDIRYFSPSTPLCHQTTFSMVFLFCLFLPFHPALLFSHCIRILLYTNYALILIIIIIIIINKDARAVTNWCIHNLTQTLR